MIYCKSENPLAASVFLGESSKVTQNLFSAADTISWCHQIFTANYIISHRTAADAKFETGLSEFPFSF